MNLGKHFLCDVIRLSSIAPHGVGFAIDPRFVHSDVTKGPGVAVRKAPDQVNF
jgi:hypothetical protein